jgi:hypothetical protein
MAEESTKFEFRISAQPAFGFRVGIFEGVV